VKVIKISDQAYEQLKNLAEKRGLSINNVVQEIINVYLGGTPEEKPIKKIVDKDITLMYATKCSRCGRPLNAGDVAHYVRYEYDDAPPKVFIYCMDCWLQSSALAKHYLKKKELEATIKGLKEMADKLADKIIRMRNEYNIALVKEELMNIRRELSLSLVRNIIGENKADELVNRIALVEQKISEIHEKLNEIEIAMKLKAKGEKREVEVYGRHY